MNTETKKQIKIDLAKFVDKIGSKLGASRQLSNVSNVTIDNILLEKWDKVSDEMFTKIAKQLTAGGDWVVLHDTKRMKMLQQVYSDAQQFSEVFCVVAPEGSGKTEPARQYAENKNVYLMKCKEHLNRKTFLGDLLTAMGKDSGGYTVYEMMGVVLEALLKTQNPVIILDEADKISDQVLYFFITIYNETEGKCGLVLQATDRFL